MYLSMKMSLKMSGIQYNRSFYGMVIAVNIIIISLFTHCNKNNGTIWDD